MTHLKTHFHFFQTNQLLRKFLILLLVACLQFIVGQPQRLTSLTASSHIIAIDEVTQSDIDALDPLKIGQANRQAEGGVQNPDQFSTLGGLVNRALEFIFPLSIAILFVMLVWGGFEMLSGAQGKSSAVQAGQKRVTSAIGGFLLLFISYWLVQVIEAVFKINIFEF